MNEPGDLLLCIDVGNTQTVLGIYRGKDLLATWRIRSDRERTADEYGHLVNDLLKGRGFDPSSLLGICISCVVPPAIQALEGMSETNFGIKPLVIGPGVKTGMPIMYDNPKEVGADRIANTVAAFERYRSPLIVIDFGTAITFDVVSGKGEYLGGVIFPGIQISLDALFLKASKLPRVELEKPPNVVGKNTIHSIQSGIIHGYAGLVDSLVMRIQKEMEEVPYVIATGGFVAVLAQESETIKEVLPDLTLEGLRILFQRNS